MRARITLRFLAMLLLAAVAITSLVTMFEVMIRAPLSFGTAVMVVLPLLVAARSAGGLLVSRSQRPAAPSAVLLYGLWCGLLGLIGLGALTMLLHLTATPAPRALLQLWLDRPLTALILLAMAYATAALITCTGFALGTRAQARLLPNR